MWKHKAVMGYARKGDTFILACPVDGCDLGGMTLHDLIKRYGESPCLTGGGKQGGRPPIQRIGYP